MCHLISTRKDHRKPIIRCGPHPEDLHRGEFICSSVEQHHDDAIHLVGCRSPADAANEFVKGKEVDREKQEWEVRVVDFDRRVLVYRVQCELIRRYTAHLVR
jgi:hypothetical protein